MSRPLLVKDPLWFDSCKQPSPQFSNYQGFEFWVALMGGSTELQWFIKLHLCIRATIINGIQM